MPEQEQLKSLRLLKPNGWPLLPLPPPGRAECHSCMNTRQCPCQSTGGCWPLWLMLNHTPLQWSSFHWQLGLAAREPQSTQAAKPDAGLDTLSLRALKHEPLRWWSSSDC